LYIVKAIFTALLNIYFGINICVSKEITTDTFTSVLQHSLVIQRGLFIKKSKI